VLTPFLDILDLWNGGIVKWIFGYILV